MDLNMPSLNSAMRGGGLPSRISAEMVLVTRAPRRLTSITLVSSLEKVPEPGMIGFSSVRDPICTRRSTMTGSPERRTPGPRSRRGDR